MSGGSFDYLYGKAVEEAVADEAFGRMIDALRAYEGGDRAALSLMAIRYAFAFAVARNEAEPRWKRLAVVLRTVERHHSGDGREGHVLTALALYNASVPPPDALDHAAAYARAAKALEETDALLRALAPKGTP